MSCSATWSERLFSPSPIGRPGTSTVLCQSLQEVEGRSHGVWLRLPEGPRTRAIPPVRHFYLPAAHTVLGEGVSLASGSSASAASTGGAHPGGRGDHAGVVRLLLFREVDRVRLKGRPMPILIFELIGRCGDAGERPVSVADFERGPIAYELTR
jgi:hypothetical protein